MLWIGRFHIRGYVRVLLQSLQQIGDNFVEKSKAGVKFSEDDGGNSISGDCFLCWA